MQLRSTLPPLAAALLLAAPLGQTPRREVPLGRVVATYPEPFGLITTARELSTGGVIVADPLGGEVMLIEPDLSRGRKLGREGAGPGEYRQPDAAWALPGDSTLVVDLGNARLTVLSPTGVFGRSIPMLLGAFRPGPGGPPPAVIPGGVDARGRIYFQSRTFAGDSAALVRLDPAGGTLDTLALLKQPEVDRQQSGTASQREVRMRPIPLSGSDAWAVAPGGAVALVRQRDYHVEWIEAGARRVGAPVPHTAVRIGSREKEEWLARQQLVGGIGVRVEARGDEVQVAFSRGRAQRERPDDPSDYRWPAEKPPFEAGSAFVDPQGRLWISRHLPAGETPLYDVFGRDGNLQASVRFPDNRRLIGFGARGLYAAAVDEDGQHTLERYALPL